MIFDIGFDYKSPLTIVAVTDLEVATIASVGDWMNLQLKKVPSEFIDLTEQDLLQAYNHCRGLDKFKAYQQRYTDDFKKELSPKRVALLSSL